MGGGFLVLLHLPPSELPLQGKVLPAQLPTCLWSPEKGTRSLTSEPRGPWVPAGDVA